MSELDPVCDQSNGGCGHFLTVHTRGLILWDRCLNPGCDCRKAILKYVQPKVTLSHKFVTGESLEVRKVEKKEEKKDYIPVLRTINMNEPVKTVVEADVKGAIDNAVQDVIKKAAKLGKKAAEQADAFIRIANANGGIVTMQQAAGINQKYPNDPAYYARLRGSQIETDKKKGGATQWRLVKE